MFKRDPDTYKYIIDAMNPYITACGKVIITDEANLKDPDLFTSKLLALKSEIDEMVAYSFENHAEF